MGARQALALGVVATFTYEAAAMVAQVALKVTAPHAA
jgi:hypothetical protein